MSNEGRIRDEGNPEREATEVDEVVGAIRRVEARKNRYRSLRTNVFLPVYLVSRIKCDRRTKKENKNRSHD